MLIKAEKSDIEKCIDFAYSLATDQMRSGYPLFSDGISTKEQFIEHVWKGFEGKNSDILLFVSDEKVDGLLQFFYIEQDRYLQITGFYISGDTGQAIAEFIEYARENFADYSLYFGFPKKNSRAIAALQNSGCELVEEAYHDIFTLENFAARSELSGVVKVDESNFSEFRKIHKTDEYTYWNSDRIFETLKDWSIYLLYRDETAAGYICARDGEIFDLGYRDNIFDGNTYKSLVTAMLNELKAQGRKHLIFFNEEESQSAALEIGFNCVAEYVLYVKNV